MVRKIGFSWEYFLIGLLFVIASLVSFNNPDSSLKAVVYVFAIAAVLKGIFELFLDVNFMNSLIKNQPY